MKQLLEKVREKFTYSQPEQLAAYNARHLEIAERFDSAVKQRLKRDAALPESQLRDLMSVAEEAQRIARLALGASTENVPSEPVRTDDGP